jgi:adenosylmethionine-8-amino-7-oxononanoate aminotransferase
VSGPQFGIGPARQATLRVVEASGTVGATSDIVARERGVHKEVAGRDLKALTQMGLLVREDEHGAYRYWTSGFRIAEAPPLALTSTQIEQARAALAEVVTTLERISWILTGGSTTAPTGKLDRQSPPKHRG